MIWLESPPSYRVFDVEKEIDLPADYKELLNLFEKYEPGSSVNLELFLKEAKYKYEVGIKQLVYQPGLSLLEFVRPEVFKGLFNLNLFGSIASDVRNKFKHPSLRKILEFPSLFLGAKPENTPGLYSLMNYADLVLGTWYPMGGMHKIIAGMHSLAQELGVKFETSCALTGFNFTNTKIKSILTEKGEFGADLVISGADYAHTESLLPIQKEIIRKNIGTVERSLPPL